MYQAQGPRCQRRIQHPSQKPIQRTPGWDSYHYRPIRPGYGWCCNWSHRLQKITWTTIEEKKQLKMQSHPDWKRAAASYRKIDMEVKRAARRDKRCYKDKLAEKVQRAAEIKDTKTVYQITKKLRYDHGPNQDLPVFC